MNANQITAQWLRDAQIVPKIGAAPDPIKKIIAGKTYNTDTASLLSLYAYDKTRDEYLHMWESLYQTRGGAFFLVAEGMSGHTPYGAELPGTNDVIRGHVLLPLDTQQVKRWLEIRDLVDDYDEIFGIPDEADNEDRSTSHVMTLRLPHRLVKKIDSLREDKESLQSFVQKAVEAACRSRHKDLLRISRNVTGDFAKA